MQFFDRQDAGQKLAKQLIQYRNTHPVILALPRGGVPVGFEIAKILHAPLEVVISRKIGALFDPEFGIGAIAEGGIEMLDNQTIRTMGISADQLEEVIQKEQNELDKRVARYRHNRPLSFLKNRTVILIDDGLATGVTARAAIAAIKKQNPKNIIFAAPVCAADTAKLFTTEVDSIICLFSPTLFEAVGQWYTHFEQTTDEEVISLLEKNKKQMQG